MSEEILLQIKEDIGELKGFVKSYAVAQEAQGKRITKVETKVADVDKRIYGVLAAAGVTGAFASTILDKLF